MTAAAPEVGGEPARGAALVRRHECNRCHEGLALGDPPEDKQCLRCHQDILAGRGHAPPETLAHWRDALRSLNVAPSLQGVAGRLRAEWLTGFLQQPIDLRPALPGSMPRMRLSEQDARDIASYLARSTPPPTRPPPPKRLASDGRGRYLQHGCPQCHAFSGAAVGGPATVERPAPAVQLAPDLRHTRQRYRPDNLVEWLLDPQALKNDSQMPRVPMSHHDAEAIAAFILYAELAPQAPLRPPARLPVLQRPVRYPEVEAQVFKKVCWHCHAEPSYARGDGGPGNTGGFGFAPRGLDLSSYQGVLSGALDDTGQRRSIFRRDATGTPRLVASLLARQREEAGDYDGDLLGMPLGFPALSPEQIQLVESWIAQGRPE